MIPVKRSALVTWVVELKCVEKMSIDFPLLQTITLDQMNDAHYLALESLNVC